MIPLQLSFLLMRVLTCTFHAPPLLHVVVSSFSYNTEFFTWNSVCLISAVYLTFDSGAMKVTRMAILLLCLPSVTMATSQVYRQFWIILPDEINGYTYFFTRYHLLLVNINNLISNSTRQSAIKMLIAWLLPVYCSASWSYNIFQSYGRKAQLVVGKI